MSKKTIRKMWLEGGGPRKEFFKLIMQAVMEKYFDKGLLPHYENDYQTVGSIFGSSTSFVG